ncbi:hypothetical protein EC973_003590 [Apophysomyces ossiformis]|uniref:Uncharacterized protein n=1 Tax=Apophysomyces ossiformis TaxID=679940 RepID=A0A8H7BXR4_9FUNG|nr:hypothetical protein EC973_003590 [Apophysomyces ossiformis]
MAEATLPLPSNLAQTSTSVATFEDKPIEDKEIDKRIDWADGISSNNVPTPLVTLEEKRWEENDEMEDDEETEGEGNGEVEEDDQEEDDEVEDDEAEEDNDEEDDDDGEEDEDEEQQQEETEPNQLFSNQTEEEEDEGPELGAPEPLDENQDDEQLIDEEEIQEEGDNTVNDAIQSEDISNIADSSRDQYDDGVFEDAPRIDTHSLADDQPVTETEKTLEVTVHGTAWMEHDEKKGLSPPAPAPPTPLVDIEETLNHLEESKNRGVGIYSTAFVSGTDQTTTTLGASVEAGAEIKKWIFSPEQPVLPIPILPFNKHSHEGEKRKSLIKCK